MDEVTLLFGGDISLEDINFDQVEAEGGFFAEVEEYFNADVSLVNLATPLATAATSLNEEFRQQTRPEAARMLAHSGVDIINLTHSNLMQYGAEGLSETLTALDSNGLYRVGAGRNATEARRPEILDVKGQRIAYLSYAMGGNNAAIDTSALKERAGAEDETVARELENFKRSTAFQERAGFNAQNMPEIVQDLQAIRDQVDWIVVNFRWVDHLEETPNFVQTNLARLAIDQGADVVVGYHPTVIQGGEIYKGRPIAYSLGDFVFKPDQPLQDQDSAMLKVSLQEEQMQVEFVPVRIRDSRPQTLTGEEGQGVLQRIQTASSQFETPLQPSVVLDLKAPAAPPPETLDPNSPFVTPEAEESLILESPAPVDADTKEEKPADSEAEADAVTPDESVPPDTVPSDTVPSDTLELPIPEGESELDLEQIDQDLQEWGPKLSPKDQEFAPVPQNRSGAEDGTLESQTEPDLLRRLVSSLRPGSVDSSAVEDSQNGDPWNDTVPAVPTPVTPMQVSPTPLSLESELAPATVAEPAAPSSTVPPAEAVSPAAPTTPTPAVSTAPAEEVTQEVVETVPQDKTDEETTEDTAKETAQDEDFWLEMEKAVPDTKVIPPQAEPLVGPLGSVDEVTDTTVALGDDTLGDAVPAVESPAMESPAMESPAMESPVAESPGTESPAISAPTVASMSMAPSAEEVTPAVETPAVETP
ncbi:MAG: CapA family protein [Limnospira maxima]